MKKSLFALSLLAAVVPVLSAQTVIEVYPAFAPNAFGSPSYAAWYGNAVLALQTGTLLTPPAPTGSFGTPGYYEPLANNAIIPASSLSVSNFANLWLGNANASATYGAAYANELGTRLHFSIRVSTPSGIGNYNIANQISISQLSFAATSSNGDLDFSFAAGVYNYSDQYVGVLYGADQAFGGGDDTYITGGPNTQLVDAIVGRGSGSAYEVLSGDAGVTNQDKVDIFASTIGNFSFSANYALGAANGGANINFVAVPEPATVLAGVAALGAVGLRFRRRK